jgi:hypothetical protein
MRRVRLLAAAVLVPLAVLATTSLSATPVSAVNPGPTQLPAVQLVAQDACSAKAVPGLTADFIPTSGEKNPGPNGKVGLTHHWSTKSFETGTYALVLSAPGYVPIGDAASGTSPITVERDPGPNGLVANSFFAEGQIIAVAMVPDIFPPNPCFDAPSLSLAELSAAVTDGKSFGAVNPGPTQLTSDATGSQVSIPDLDSNGHLVLNQGAAPGGYTLSVSAPGYQPLGTTAGGGFTPVGITVEKNPGPIGLPGGDSFSEGLAVLIELAPAG